jgi:hypothetical protein
MEETLNLRKKREFGEVFNATVIFLKQEFKLFGKAYLYYVFPIAILIAIISGYNQVSMVQGLKNVRITNAFSLYGAFYGKYMLTYAMLIVNQSLILTLIYSYMKLYLEKGSGNFNLQEIAEKMKSNFFKILLAVLLVFVIVIIGTVCCIVPGIYLGVSVSLIFCIMLFENKSIGEAFSRSFELTRIQWWSTFLILFVSYVIVLLIIYILAIPLSIYGFTVGMHSLKSTEDFSGSLSVVMGIYTSFTTLISAVIYLIPLTVIAFQYFNLVEIKEMPSLIDKIDQMTNEIPKSE